MISRIRGSVENIRDNRLELRVGDLCYEVLVPAYLEAGLRGRGGETGGLFLYNFLGGGGGGAPRTPPRGGVVSESARALHPPILKVPGLGAKSVLKMLVVPPVELARAIEREDRAALAGLPGVGRRTADKIIAELKGKLASFAFEPGAPAGGPSPTGSWGEAEDEAGQVLRQLDYKPAEAERLIRLAKSKDPDLADAEAIVAAVLRLVGSEALR
jgi:Holliday junction DNA helicase RuvA